MAWRYNLPKCPVSPADRGEFMKTPSPALSPCPFCGGRKHPQPQQADGRGAVIEECARVADAEQARAIEQQREANKADQVVYGLPQMMAAVIAARIRELKYIRALQQSPATDGPAK